MLHIDLVREVPEALKPRRIEIAQRRHEGHRGRNRLIAEPLPSLTGAAHSGPPFSFTRAADA
jgi:hypothetical protein